MALVVDFAGTAAHELISSGTPVRAVPLQKGHTSMGRGAFGERKNQSTSVFCARIFHTTWAGPRSMRRFAFESFDARISGRRWGMVGHACPGPWVLRGRGSGRYVTSNRVIFRYPARGNAGGGARFGSHVQIRASSSRTP
jgi:hypothetical protein